MAGADGLVKVYAAGDPADAQLVCNLLLDAGIRAIVQGDVLWGARGEIPMGPSTAPGVWVAAGDAERARALIDEQAALPAGDEPWRCPRCGEWIEGQFSECWNCAPAVE